MTEYLPNGQPVPGQKKKKKKKSAPAGTTYNYNYDSEGHYQGVKVTPPKPKPAPNLAKVTRSPVLPHVPTSDFDQPDPMDVNIKNLTKAWMEKYNTRPTAQQAFELMSSVNNALTPKEWTEILAPGLATDPFTQRLARLGRIYMAQTGSLPSPEKLRQVLGAQNPDDAAKQAANGPRGDDMPPIWKHVNGDATREAGARFNRPGAKWTKKDLKALGRIGEPMTAKEADEQRKLANTTIHGDTMALTKQEDIWEARGWYMPTSVKQKILARQAALHNDDGTFNEDNVKMFSISTGQNNGNMKDPNSFAWAVNHLGGKPRSQLTKKEKNRLDAMAGFLADVYNQPGDAYKPGAKPVFDQDMYAYASRYLLESSLPYVLTNHKVGGKDVVTPAQKAIAMINISVATGGKVKPEDNIYQWLTEMRMLGSADEMYSEKLSDYLFDSYRRTTGRGHSFEMQVAGFASIMGDDSVPRNYNGVDTKKILNETRGQFSNIYMAIDAQKQSKQTGVPNILSALSAGVLADIKVMNDYQSGKTTVDPNKAKQFVVDPNSLSERWSAIPKTEYRRKGKSMQVLNPDPFDPVSRWVDEEFVPTVGGVALGFMDGIERIKNQVFLTLAFMGDNGKGAGFHVNMAAQVGEMTGGDHKHKTGAALAGALDVRVPTSVDAWSWHSIRNSWSAASKKVNANGEYLDDPNKFGGGNIFDKMATTFQEDPSKFTFGNRAYMENQFKIYGLDPREHETLLFWTDMAWSLALDLVLDAGFGVVKGFAKKAAQGAARELLSPALKLEVDAAQAALTATKSARMADRAAYTAARKVLVDRVEVAERAGFSEIASNLSSKLDEFDLAAAARTKNQFKEAAKQSATLELLNRPKWYDPYAFGLSRGTQKGWQLERIMGAKTHGMDPDRVREVKRVLREIGQSHDEDAILKKMNYLRMMGVKLDAGESWLGKTRNYSKWTDGDPFASAKHIFPTEERIVNGAMRADDTVEALGTMSNMGMISARKAEARERVNFYLKRMFDVDGPTQEVINYKKQQIWREFTDEIKDNMKNTPVTDEMVGILEKWGKANGFDIADIRLRLASEEGMSNWDAFEMFRRIKQHKTATKPLSFGRVKDLPVYAVNDDGMVLGDVEFLASVKGGNKKATGQMSKDLVAPFNMQDLVSFQRGRAGMEMWMHTGMVNGIGPSWMGLVNASKTIAIANMAFPISAFFIDEFWRFPVEYSRGNMAFNPLRYHMLRKELKASGHLREVGGDVITSLMGRSKTMIPVGPTDPNYHKWLNAFNAMFEKNDFFQDFKNFLDEFPKAADETDEMFRERFGNFLTDKILEESDEGDLLRLHMQQTHKGFDGPMAPGPELRAANEVYNDTAKGLEDDMAEVVGKLHGEDGTGGLIEERAAFNAQTLTRTMPPKTSKTLPFSEAQLEVFPEHTVTGSMNKDVYNAMLRWKNNPTTANFENLRTTIRKDLQRKIDLATKEVTGIRAALKDEAQPTVINVPGAKGEAMGKVADATDALEVLRKSTAKMADDELSSTAGQMDELLKSTTEELKKLKAADKKKAAEAKLLQDAADAEEAAAKAEVDEAAAVAETAGDDDLADLNELITPKKNPFTGWYPEKSAPDGLVQVIDDFMSVPSMENFNAAKQQLTDYYSGNVLKLTKRIKQMEDDEIRGLVQDHVMLRKLQQARMAFLDKIDEIDKKLKYRERRVRATGKPAAPRVKGINDDAIADVEKKIAGVERSIKSNVKLGLEDLNKAEQRKIDRLTGFLEELKKANKPEAPKAAKAAPKPKPHKPDPKIAQLEGKIAGMENKVQQIQTLLAERSAKQAEPFPTPKLEGTGALDTVNQLPGGTISIPKPKPNMSPAGVKKLQAKVRAFKKQMAALDNESMPVHDVIDYGPTQKQQKLGSLLDIKRPQSKRWIADWFRFRHKQGLESYMSSIFDTAEGVRKATDDDIMQSYSRLSKEQKAIVEEQMKMDWRAEVYEVKGLTGYAAQRDAMDKAIEIEKANLKRAQEKLAAHLETPRPTIPLDSNSREWLQRSVDRLFQWNGIPELWDAAVNGTQLTKKQVAKIQAQLAAEGKTLPVVIGAANDHAGLWGSGPWINNAGEYGRIPIINKLAEIGPYKVLDELSNATRRHAYLGRTMVELDELERLGFDITSDEAKEIAHNRAMTYTDDVMYSSGKTAVEQDTRGLFMFMPAYRQAIQYWGKEIGRNPFFYMGVRNKINTDFPQGRMGDYTTMIPMPFWAQGNLAEAVVPGLVPPILAPLRVVNTMSGWDEITIDDGNGQSHKEWQYTGNTKFDWMSEGKVINLFTGFASKNVSPLSFIDEFMWGMTGDNQFTMPTVAGGWVESRLMSFALALRKDPIARRKAAMNIYAAQVSRGMKPDMTVAEAQIAGSPWWFNLLQKTGIVTNPEGIFKAFTGTVMPRKFTYAPSDIGEIVYAPGEDRRITDVWGLLSADEEAKTIADAEWLYIKAETPAEKQAVLDKYPKYKKIVDFRQLDAYERAVYLADPKNRGEDTILPYVGSRNEYTPGGKLLLGDDYYSALREGMIRKKDMYDFIQTLQKLNVNAQWDQVKFKLDEKLKTDQKAAQELLRKAAKEMAVTPTQYQSYLADILRFKNGWVDKPVPTQYKQEPIEPMPWMVAYADKHKLANSPWKWNLQAINDNYWDSLAELGADTTETDPAIVAALRAQGVRLPKTDNEKALRPEGANMGGVESMYSNPRVKNWDLEHGVGGMNRISDALSELMAPEDRQLFDLKGSMSAHAIKLENKKNAEYRKYLTLKYAGSEYWKFVGVKQMKSIGVPVENEAQMTGLLVKLDNLYELKKLKTEGLEVSSDEYKAVLKWYKTAYKQALAPKWAEVLREGPARRLMYTELVSPGAGAKLDMKYVQMALTQMHGGKPNWDFMMNTFRTSGAGHVKPDKVASATAWMIVLGTAINYRNRMANTYNEWGDYSGVTPDSKAGEPYVNRLTSLVTEWKKRSRLFKRSWEDLGGDTMIPMFLDGGS